MPGFLKFDFDPDLIKAMFANWNQFPDKAYCERVGWHVNEDGTVNTPGLGLVPTRELCEVRELEAIYHKQSIYLTKTINSSNMNIATINMTTVLHLAPSAQFLGSATLPSRRKR